MKLAPYRLSLREGLRNLVRHPLVTMASITTITLMLFLMGAFIIFSMNARAIAEKAGQQPPVEITLEIGVSQEEIQAIQAMLAADEAVVDTIIHTPEENFEQFKANMEKVDLFEEFTVDVIPYTISVHLSDPAMGSEFAIRAGGMPGVRKVSLELEVMAFLNSAIRGVNYATLIAFAVLGLIAFFIISNMVRIAVFSRAEEINIMKYVGATNWYIRVPFIIEGAFVGLTGALLATLIVVLIYIRLYNTLMGDMAADSFLALLPIVSVGYLVLLFNIGIGTLLGSIGSALSVRRHIKV